MKYESSGFREYSRSILALTDLIQGWMTLPNEEDVKSVYAVRWKKNKASDSHAFHRGMRW
jgi:hypothetical protein